MQGTIVRQFLAAHWRWRWLRGERLARFQTARARQMVHFTAEHSPFYRAHWAGHDLNDWRTLPTVDKATMMANFDRFNTRGVALDAAMPVALAAERSRDFTPTVAGCTVGLSSGTSGHRGIFLVSAQEQAAWAGVILARALHRIRRGGTRVAFFLRSFSNLYAQAGRSLIQLRYFDLMTPIDEAITALNTYNPHIVVAPPSLLGFLADGQAAGRLTIRPDRLISVAEVLEPQDRARLSQLFDAPVHQIYQCTEGLLAVSCAQGSLHLQEDIVAVQCEPIGDAGEEVPSLLTGDSVTSHRTVTHHAPRTTCHPIITDLWRTTQPIIRYRLNDVITLDTRRCPCGSHFRVVAAIEGRCDDVCYFQAQDGLRRAFFPDTIRRMILLASPDIVDYQAFQSHDGHLRIHLAAAPGAAFDGVAAAVVASTTATVAAYGCRPPTIRIEAGLQPTPAGAKRRRIQRL